MAGNDKSEAKLSGAPILALCGFMAVGKSTVGRTLASMLRWRFIDLDCEIECRSGLHVPEIFTAHGEARFRELETEALRLVLEQAHAPLVIALGGGTFVQPQNRALLSEFGVRAAFLELPVSQLLQRCRTASQRPGGATRPLAADAEAFCTLYAQRLPHYRKAEWIVNTENKTLDQIAREITSFLISKRPAART